MKRITKLFGIAVIAAIVFAMAACGGGNEGPSPGPGPVDVDKVTKVTVTVEGGGKAEIWRTGEIKLSAQVEGQGAYSKDVTWSIIEEEEDEVDVGTGISKDGVLTVGLYEWYDTLTIRAISDFTKTQSGTLKIAIVEPPFLIWIEGDSARRVKAVEKGIQLKFTSNSFNVPVTWSITGAGYDAGTTISADGTLKVSKEETQASLTVKGVAGAEEDLYTLNITPMGDLSILFGNWTRKQGAIATGPGANMGTSVIISSTAITVTPGLGEMEYASDWEPFFGSGSLWGGASGFTKGYRVVGNEKVGTRLYPHGILVFYKADGGDGKPRIGISVNMTEPSVNWPSTVINSYNSVAEYEIAP